jgi:activator of 2-hydroxyglutaryl-CoA dehydratase
MVIGRTGGCRQMTDIKSFAGIDVGTTMTKAVVISTDMDVLGQSVRRSGADLASAAIEAFGEAMSRAKVSREAVKFVVATATREAAITTSLKRSRS